LRAITGSNSSDAQPVASLPDELNTFYALFEVSNTTPTARLAEDQADCTPSLTMVDVRRALKRINPRKSPGPDGIPGRLLIGCTNQLAEVFPSIFNLFLYQSAVPTCFKQTTIVPVPKKPSITCLNDYRPVALSPIIMKCFKRLVRTHICSTHLGSLLYRPNRSTYDGIHTLGTYAIFPLLYLNT